MNHPVYTRCRVWRAHHDPQGQVLKLGTCRAWHVSITQHDASRRVVYRSPFMMSFDTWREAMDYAFGEV
ncbi:hypothetical protein [Nocardia nova]|uniref:hypothetical protein n=1 Tax=Nocardia nova TaxID=37330 RepID=UPI0018934A3C|nr:hypothetical protein [Nocardia nova]MBF6277016.1 hypothetical protein [Nocardia nova]